MGLCSLCCINSKQGGGTANVQQVTPDPLRWSDLGFWEGRYRIWP